MTPRTVCILLLFVSSCSVFDESMRKTKGSSSGASGTLEKDAGNESASCEMQAPAGTGAGTCGGAGGGFFGGEPEREPNDEAPESLTIESLVCGEVGEGDEDRFEVAVKSGGCLEIVFESTGAIATVTGTDVKQSLKGGMQLPIQAKSSGTINVVVTASRAASYRLLVR